MVAEDKNSNDCPGHWSCGNAPSYTSHTCPFEEEIHNDMTECHCCSRCTDNCAREI